ncbi:MAG: hypothetical protein NUV80_05145, partial [Candidatus Berkelbacteria bacterium]|nr:hypothetical protein [Candidatus Berkelbacteria bacterium]
MKCNVESGVTDFEGKVIELGEKKEKYTYRMMIGTLLQTADPQSPDSSDLKSKVFEIATKLYSQKEPDFTAEQIVIINEKAGRWASALEMGRLKEFL